MKLRYVYVDAVTRIPCTDAPMTHGPDAPLPSISFEWANESEWPTSAGVMYGSAPDGTTTSVPGVLAVLTEAEYAAAWDAELAARRGKVIVTARQARLALLQAGLLDQVADAIAAIHDPAQREAAGIEWEYATEVKRLHPWVVALGSGLGLSDSEIDDLFAVAATL